MALKKLGSEWTTSNMLAADVFGLSNGTFLAVWVEHEDGQGRQIRGQILEADGSYPHLGVFTIASVTTGSLSSPVAVSLGGGRFAIAWNDNTDGLGDSEFRTAIFDATGKIQGSIRSIDDATYSRMITPLPNGGYAVAYWQAGNKLAFFDRDGAPITTETVGTATEDLRGITALSDGSVLSVVSTYPTPTSSAITAYLRQTNGQTKTIALAEFEGSSDMIRVITLANSNVVVVWCEDNALKARIVTAQGNVLGGELTLHQATSGSLEELKVEALPEGGFAVAFVNRSSEVGVGTDVYLGVYSAAGTAIEAPSVVGRTTTGSQSIPSIAVMKDGRIVVSWNDMDDEAMHFQAYDPRTKAVNVLGDDASDRFVGTAFDDVLRGGGGADRLRGEDGNDVLDGGTGADLMFGGAGDDTYHVDSVDDRIVEMANAGFDHVITTVSQDLWDEVENLTAVGADAVTLNGNELSNKITGNAGQNVLNGNAGDDTLDGGSGADSLIGGAGDDVFYVDHAGDQVVEVQGGGRDTIHASISVSLSAGQEIEVLAAAGAAGLTLKGNALANTISGNAGANRLWGGLGNDQLTGGSGKDIFVFDTRPNSKTNRDKITDFSVKDDTIWLDNKVFTKLGKKGSEKKPAKLDKGFFVVGSKAKDKNDYVVYDKKKGILLYDADGSGKGKAVEVATLSRNLKMTEKDFFVV